MYRVQIYKDKEPWPKSILEGIHNSKDGISIYNSMAHLQPTIGIAIQRALCRLRTKKPTLFL